MLTKLLLIILFTGIVLSKKKISIQSTKQNYKLYLPYIKDCNYSLIDLNGSKFELFKGDSFKIDANESIIFDTVDYEAHKKFWMPVLDGIRILLRQKDLIDCLDQDNISSSGILYNYSTIHNDLTRKITLFYVTYQYEVNFVKKTPKIKTSLCNQIDQKPITMNFNNNDVTTLIQNCSNNSFSFQYIGQKFLVGICKQTGGFFIWQDLLPENVSIGNIFKGKTSQKIRDIDGITYNPNLMNKNEQQFAWSIMLLTKNRSTLYFCSFNFSQLTRSQCLTLKEGQLLFNEMMFNLYGSKNSPDYFSLIRQLQDNLQINIPDNLTIKSVHLDEKNFLFIHSYESINDKSHLYVYQMDFSELKGILDFQGQIITHTQNGLLLKNNMSNNISYSFFYFYFPYFKINASQLYQTNTTQIQLKYQSDSKCKFLNINYKILWSQYDEPFGYIENLAQSVHDTSQHSELTYHLNKRFKIFGPAMQISINNNLTLRAQYINIISIFPANKDCRVFDLYRIVNYGISRQSYSNYQDNSTISVIQGSVNQSYRNKCGIKNFQAKKISDNIVLFNKSQYCLCNKITCMNMTVYELIQKIPQLTDLETQKIQARRFFQKKASLNIRNQHITSIFFANTIIITIFKNNSISVSFRSEQPKFIQHWQNMKCPEYQTTQATIFERKLYDSILIIVCNGGKSIYHYQLRNDQLQFVRQIPLYGFIVRQKTNQRLFVGRSFAYLEVYDSEDTISGPYEILNSKHVLRIDPTQFTVSVIKQLVDANIKQLYYFGLLDTIQYTTQDNKCFMQTYQSRGSVAISQITSGTQQINTTQDYEIWFRSRITNFGSVHKCTVNFNLQNLKIEKFSGFTGVRNTTIQMKSAFPHRNRYQGHLNYHLTDTCGPIKDIKWLVQQNNQSMMQIDQNDPINSVKRLFEVTGSIVEQILQPNIHGKNNKFFGLILVICVNEIFFYQKLSKDGVVMKFIVVIEKQIKKACEYSLYRMGDNQTCIQFLFTCDKTYNGGHPSLIQFCYNDTDKQKPITKKILNKTNLFKIQLQNIQTIPLSSPLVFGFQRTTIGSITGKLYMCDKDNRCTMLYKSTINKFILSYDVFLIQNNYIIVALDSSMLYFWINLTTQKQFSYSQYNVSLKVGQNQKQSPFDLDERCSMIRFVTFQNNISATLLLSCETVYYQITVQFLSHNHSINKKYIRFAGCEDINRFRPQIVYNKDKTIKHLLAYCNWVNDAEIIKQLQQNKVFSADTSKSGYLQLFSENYGPKCDDNRYQPVKVMDMSTADKNTLFLTFPIQGINSQRILYSPLNNILIDGIIEDNLQLKFTMLTSSIKPFFPKVSVTYSNDFFSTTFQLKTVNILSNEYKIIIFYFIISIIVIQNILTIIFLIYFLLLRKKQHQFLEKSKEFGQQAEKKHTQSDSLNRQTKMSIFRNHKSAECQQIELFTPKYLNKDHQSQKQ